MLYMFIFVEIAHDMGATFYDVVVDDKGMKFKGNSLGTLKSTFSTWLKLSDVIKESSTAVEVHMNN